MKFIRKISFMVGQTQQFLSILVEKRRKFRVFRCNYGIMTVLIFSGKSFL